MKKYTETELEIIENSIMDSIDDNLNIMLDGDKEELIDMIIDTLESRKEEIL
jgi:hypothetical protein